MVMLNEGKFESVARDLAFRISKNEARLNTQIDLLKELSVENQDAARCIKGIAEELAKTNKRMDALVADREKHQRRLDDRLEEVIEATQEAEKAFLVRIERAERKRDAAYGELGKVKREMEKIPGFADPGKTALVSEQANQRGTD